MEEKVVVASLAALAQGMRLRIFRALIGVPGSTLSFHLKELTYAGLVSQEREGRNLIYRPSIEQMNALLGYLSARCCRGADCEAPKSSGCSTRRSKGLS
jgi:DNA-binding transcriptional ArsR family regulator